VILVVALDYATFARTSIIWGLLMRYGYFDDAGRATT
jgi:hypothetical protein